MAIVKIVIIIFANSTQEDYKNLAKIYHSKEFGNFLNFSISVKGLFLGFYFNKYYLVLKQ